MALKLTDGGGELILKVFFEGFTRPTTWSVALFTDSNALNDADQGSGRVLAAGGGYTDKDLTAVASAVDLNPSGIPCISWDDITWTFTGPLTGGVSIKGYVVIADTTFIHEELLDSPYIPGSDGGLLTISPQFLLGNGTPT